MSLTYDIEKLFMEQKVDQILEIFKVKLDILYIQFYKLNSSAREKGLYIDDLTTSVNTLSGLQSDSIVKLRDTTLSELNVSDSLRQQLKSLLADSVKELLTSEANHETKKEN